MNTIFKYLCVPALIILPASSIYAEGEDVKLQNEKSLTGPDNDYHGKNLFITWTKDDNGGDAPVKGAQIIAQNITIETNFPDKYPNGIRRGMYRGILNKGIYNTDNYQSDITAPGTIKILTYDDGIYTESNAKANIKGFKNLIITSKAGFGVVDNGGGINIEGGDDSAVTIKTESEFVPGWFGIMFHQSRPAIGSHYFSENLGNGISIRSGRIELDSAVNYSIFAGNGKKGRFEVNLDASEIDITGTIYGDGGNITITPRADGRVTISPNESQDDSIYLSKGSTLTINKDSAELKEMQISGKINVNGEGTSLLANMTGNSAIALREGSSSTVAIEASDGGNVNLNMSGANSSITGDLKTGTGQKASITANLSGEGSHFTGNAEVIGDCSSEGNEINLTLSGDNARQVGKLKAEGNNTLKATYSGRGSALVTPDNRSPVVDNKGIMNLSFTNQAVLNGDVLNGVHVYKDDNSQPLKTFEGKLTANFEQSSHWTGNLSNRGGRADVTLGNGGRWAGDLDNQGGTANVTLKNGGRWTGKASMSGTGAATNVSVNEGATWKVTADSTVSTLKVSGGHVDLGGFGIRMNIGHLSPGDGNPGTFHMDLTYHDNQCSTYETAKDSDFLYVGGGTGHTFRVEATENSSINGMRDGDKLYFARTAQGVAAFDVNQEVLIRNWDKIYNKALRVETEAASVTEAKAKKDAPSLTVTGAKADTAAPSGSVTGTSADTAAPSGAMAGAKAKKAALFMAAASAGEDTAAPSEDAASSGESTAASSEADAGKNTKAASSDNDDVWYLTPENTPLDNGFVANANAYVPGSAHNAAASIWRDNDTLVKRLGELRWSKDSDGAWGRVINRKLARSGTQAFDVSMNTLQLGYDRKIPFSFGDIFVGGAVEHSRGTEKYDDGDGSVYMTDGALYGTFVGRSGDYVDVVTKAGRLFTHYSSDLGDGGDFENWGFSASAEYGHKFDLGWSWSVEPQAQIKYSYLWGDDYTSDNGAKIYQDDTDSLVGRLGLLVAKEFGTGTENPVRIYAKGSVLHEFLGDRDETLYQDVAMHDSTDLAGTWYSAGVGANVGLSENCSLYVDAERDFGTDIKVQYRIQGGFRFEF